MFKALKVTVSALLTVILAPIAFLAATLLTDGGRDTSKAAAFDKTTLVNDKMVSALENVETNKGLKFTFNNDDMDSLFNFVYNNYIATNTAGQYIKRFYCDAKENNRWDFTVVGGWNAFNTKVTLPATLKEEDNNLVFTFDAPVLGRLNTSFAREYINKLGKMLKINNLLQGPLQQLGIDGIKVDLEDTGTISIPKIGLMNYATKLSKASEPNELVKPLLTFFNQSDGSMVKTATNKEIGINLDMSDLTKDKSDFGDKMPVRSNGGIPDLVAAFHTDLKNYIKDMKEEAKGKESYDFTSNLTTRIESNEIKKGKENLFDSLKNQMKVLDPNNITILGNISANDIFDFVRKLNVVGKTTTYSKKMSDGSYSVSHITVESFDANFYTTNNGESRVSIFVPINVNGMTILPVLDYKITNDSTPTIVLFGDETDPSDNKLFIGKKEVTGDAKTDFMKLVSDAIGNLECLQITDNGSIKIVFTSAIDECENPEVKAAISALLDGGKTISFESIESNSNINDGGALKLTISN